MNFILLPVKDLARAKQRLAGLMTQPERTELARLMMEHTFAQVAGVRGCDGVAIVTNYEPAVRLARRYGFEVIGETEQISESASVDFGSRVLAGRGVRTVLRLPIDLPLIAAADIEAILARVGDEPAAVMVPSRDGTGTNALLRTPPDLFPSHFGPHSLAKHQAEAAQRQARCELIELPRIALDVDDPSDLAFLLAQNTDSNVHAYLNALRISERMS
ncbi:MAG TPA: 2-phospho-L-lactate guanylyltransferase [Blastocatellia bacterium]|nr:2-phospho-L-lactate guanylyltransferase [Blastocatellia bacterium]